MSAAESADAKPDDKPDSAAEEAAAKPAAEPADELAERTADLQRVTAEYHNYRKRVERDKTAAADGATASVLTALLPVLDDIDRARDHGDLVGPFGSVAESLENTLTKLGLEVFGTKGDPFDPVVHEAVAHMHSAEVTEPSCIDVMRRGYRIGDRLLRPAMVAVAEPEAEVEVVEAEVEAEVVEAEAVEPEAGSEPEAEESTAAESEDEATEPEGEADESSADAEAETGDDDPDAAAEPGETTAESGTSGDESTTDGDGDSETDEPAKTADNKPGKKPKK